MKGVGPGGAKYRMCSPPGLGPWEDWTPPGGYLEPCGCRIGDRNKLSEQMFSALALEADMSEPRERTPSGLFGRLDRI
jgi:hypothetical protein